MKKIALLCQHFYPEMLSTGMLMTELAVGLSRRGVPLIVFCAQPTLKFEDQRKFISSYLNYERIDIYRVPALGSHRSRIARALFSFSYLLSTSWVVIRARKSLKGIIITTNPPFIGIVGVFMKIFFRKPFFIIIHDIYPEIVTRLGLLSPRSLLAKFWESLSRLILAISDAIVVIGRDMSDIIKNKVRKREHGKIILIPNWSDETKVFPVPPHLNAYIKEKGLGGHFVVQYAGRMGRTHNIEPLLEAAEMLQNQPVIFQFIGDGAKKEKIKKICSEKKLKNVHILPYEPIERLGAMLSASHLSVVCLESSFTGLSVPSKTYGIMASGRPILAFLDPAGEIGRTIVENECGIVLKNPSAEKVAGIIIDLIKNPQKYEKMGQNSYMAFINNYTLSLAVAHYHNLIHNVFKL